MSFDKHLVESFRLYHLIFEKYFHLPIIRTDENAIKKGQLRMHCEPSFRALLPWYLSMFFTIIVYGEGTIVFLVLQEVYGQTGVVPQKVLFIFILLTGIGIMGIGSTGILIAMTSDMVNKNNLFNSKVDSIFDNENSDVAGNKCSFLRTVREFCGVLTGTGNRPYEIRRQTIFLHFTVLFGGFCTTFVATVGTAVGIDPARFLMEQLIPTNWQQNPVFSFMILVVRIGITNIACFEVARVTILIAVLTVNWTVSTDALLEKMKASHDPNEFLDLYTIASRAHESGHHETRIFLAWFIGASYFVEVVLIWMTLTMYDQGLGFIYPIFPLCAIVVIGFFMLLLKGYIDLYEKSKMVTGTRRVMDTFSLSGKSYKSSYILRRVKSLRSFQYACGSVLKIEKGTPLDYLSTLSERVVDALILF
ncbi:unnamed protein product [Orchesella dallaii]|uniref:Gustatory receptor n=1 Tax=Orchesella dallaii TaxID=48710 RepID=A0ABP1QWG5_9HEXA